MLIVLMFGLGCTGPCTAPPEVLHRLEQRAVRAMGKAEMKVKPAPLDALRPTGLDAPDVRTDVARSFGVDRVVALDFDPSRRVLWLTWFANGVPGPWRVSKVHCQTSDGEVSCRGLDRVIKRDARPRRAGDVDVLGTLRHAAPLVGKCVAAESRRPAAMRQYGRVELSLEIPLTGRVRVTSIAPARVAKSALGRCLRKAMAKQDVGRFTGAPIKLRIPIDL